MDKAEGAFRAVAAEAQNGREMAERKKLTTKKILGMGAIALTVMIVLMWVRSQLSGLLGQI